MSVQMAVTGDGRARRKQGVLGDLGVSDQAKGLVRAEVTRTHAPCTQTCPTGPSVMVWQWMPTSQDVTWPISPLAFLPGEQ